MMIDNSSFIVQKDLFRSTNFLPTYSSLLLVKGMISALKALPLNIELVKKRISSNETESWREKASEVSSEICLTVPTSECKILHDPDTQKSEKVSSPSTYYSLSDSTDVSYSTCISKEETKTRGSRTEIDLHGAGSSILERFNTVPLNNVSSDCSRKRVLIRDSSQIVSEIDDLKKRAISATYKRSYEDGLGKDFSTSENRAKSLCADWASACHEHSTRIPSVDEQNISSDSEERKTEGYVCVYCRKLYGLDSLSTIDNDVLEIYGISQAKTSSKGVQTSVSVMTRDIATQCSPSYEGFSTVDEGLSLDINIPAVEEELDPRSSGLSDDFDKKRRLIQIKEYKNRMMRKQEGETIYEVDMRPSWIPSNALSSNFLFVQFDKRPRILCAVAPLKQRRKSKYVYGFEGDKRCPVIPLKSAGPDCLMQDPRLKQRNSAKRNTNYI